MGQGTSYSAKLEKVLERECLPSLLGNLDHAAVDIATLGSYNSIHESR